MESLDVFCADLSGSEPCGNGQPVMRREKGMQTAEHVIHLPTPLDYVSY